MCCKWGITLPVEVTIAAEHSYTGEERQATKPIDSCIALIVDALNRAGIVTEGSCCGHGKADGWVVLSDGRKLTISENDRTNCTCEGEELEPCSPQQRKWGRVCFVG